MDEARERMERELEVMDLERVGNRVLCWTVTRDAPESEEKTESMDVVEPLSRAMRGLSDEPREGGTGTLREDEREGMKGAAASGFVAVVDVGMEREELRLGERVGDRMTPSDVAGRAEE